MVTVGDLAQAQVSRRHHNHETYKILYQQVDEHIRRLHKAGCTETTWIVPMFVIGRGIYEASHAVNYIRDKLRRGGFVVFEYGTGLHISWAAQLQEAVRDVMTKPKKAVAVAKEPTEVPLSVRLERLNKSLTRKTPLKSR